MRRVAWQSNPSTKVRPVMILQNMRHVPKHEHNMHFVCVEMLTAVDQPLDKLDDLTPDEMYVLRR